MKKFIRYFLLTLLLLVVLFAGYAVVSGKTYLFKAVWYNFADINDYEKFTNNTVTTATTHQPWPVSTSYNKHSLPDSLSHLLQELQTIGLVVIHRDSILYEQYRDGYTDSSWSGSFSIAKSITSLLIGAAIKDGRIASVQEPVSRFLPEFATGKKASLKIIDLLTMSSGTDWNESYADPLSVTTELYYGSDVYKVATGVNVVQEPGSLWRYKSGDTQLLGLVVEKATGKSLSAYAAEKLWHPLGAEHPALWSTDHTGGHEKAYCCFNSNARDFARLGQLMLDSGRWKGQEIISPEYYKQAVTANMIKDEDGQSCDYYGFQWWIFPGNEPVFYARGILGQYIIVIPSTRTVIVRLGKKRADLRINHAPAEVNAMVNWGKSFQH